jgi:hypothetical protein
MRKMMGNDLRVVRHAVVKRNGRKFELTVRSLQSGACPHFLVLVAKCGLRNPAVSNSCKTASEPPVYIEWTHPHSTTRKSAKMKLLQLSVLCCILFQCAYSQCDWSVFYAVLKSICAPTLTSLGLGHHRSAYGDSIFVFWLYL